MAYDTNFYELYRHYLREPSVRASHAEAFNCFRALGGATELSVIDFGCGLGEYRRHGSYKKYAGVDVNDSGAVPDLIKTDYHNLDFLETVPFIPNAFVSLFSIECCHRAEEKYALYRNIFKKMPSIQFGMTAGFFYQDRSEQEVVYEAGGLESYQTIESQSDYLMPLFSELRLTLRTPSTLFGSDVVEVWKFFKRRKLGERY